MTAAQLAERFMLNGYPRGVHVPPEPIEARTVVTAIEICDELIQVDAELRALQKAEPLQGWWWHLPPSEIFRERNAGVSYKRVLGLKRRSK